MGSTIEFSKDKDPELDVALVLLLRSPSNVLKGSNFIQICFSSKWSGATKDKPKYTTHDALKHVCDLYRERILKYRYCYPLVVMSLLDFSIVAD
ncbi:hypothetical protein HID58_055348 [Brassica napus]|uniref:Uncharacterized protein n=1 Tax=Brassica napus TaxID=3708 RepID=A0ABQ8AK18_BRANA|nr:hypothetical protein HID58_055348 [Brassica napus]